MPVVRRLGRSIGIDGAREMVVCEDHRGTNENTPTQNRWFINKGIILNLAVVADNDT
jgi:hypothetical protein